MAKTRMALFLSCDVERALAEYTRRHRVFTTTSQSVDHLLRRALLSGLGEDLEELLLSSVREAVRSELESLLERTRLLEAPGAGGNGHHNHVRTSHRETSPMRAVPPRCAGGYAADDGVPIPDGPTDGPEPRRRQDKGGAS